MSNPIPPIVPLPDDAAPDSVPTREVDGETVLDHDADDTQVTSAEADRIASTADSDPSDDE
jgi:hypothetical protein